MRIAIINMLSVGSTGTIAKQIRDVVNKHGGEAVVYTGNWGKNEDTISFGYKCENKISGALSKVFGVHHIYSIFGTLELIKKLDDFSPDIVHLHNLHLWVVNVPILMKYLKRKKVKVVWTLHDCWSFTGRCPHFLITKCEQWKYGCDKCVFPKESYPHTFFFDKASVMWKKKKKWFSGFDNLTIVTPSEWLGNLVKESFLRDYPIRIIKNGIDLDVFKERTSAFRKKYDIENKKIILGVAFDWGYRKGLDIFCELSQKLTEEYRIVLVGTTEDIDKELPSNIISINRTSDPIELAELYSTADVFLNPTREDTFPTVNMEALACGTPVITFDTGGSPEIVNEFTGVVIKEQKIDTVIAAIEKCCDGHDISNKECRRRAVNLFEKNDRYQEYYTLYQELI